MQAEPLTPPKFGQIICPQRRVCVFRTGAAACGNNWAVKKIYLNQNKKSLGRSLSASVTADAGEMWRCVRGQVTLAASTLARDICGPAFNFPESLVVVCGIYSRICFDDFVF